jgi:polysaccharide export outer membrane protein
VTPARVGAAEAAYLLGPEDVVEVFVWKEEGLSTTATVRPDGRITLPLAGELVAAKRTAQQLQEEIATRLAHYIDLPVVTVIVKEINSPLFSVLGEVRRPGRYRLAQRTSVLDAVALGGGFTEYADRGRVTVLRPSERGVERIPINLKKLLRRGGESFYLQPRDTVHVE